VCAGEKENLTERGTVYNAAKANFKRREAGKNKVCASK